MSSQLFVYYCAIMGGWMAMVGWALGLAAPADLLWRAGFRGLLLGVTVAAGLSLVDSRFNLGPGRYGAVLGRVSMALLVGGLGGFAGGFLGQLLIDLHRYFLLLGWMLTGLFIGGSLTLFELIASLRQRTNLPGAMKKWFQCMVGGTLGGILGGGLAMMLIGLGPYLFPSKDPNDLWSPTALGFVVLGAWIGLLVGLTQVILRVAWLTVEEGFRPGRELILTKEATTLGRAEDSDLGLFGDQNVEKLHARIIMNGNGYALEDVKTPAGTFVNNVAIAGRTPLKTGDLIRLGRNVVRFTERQKKP